MRVILTNHTMNDIGGTQVWVKTMQAELDRRGHETEVWTVSDKKPKDADLILVNHNTCLAMLNLMKVGGFKVFTSHGPEHTLEAFFPGADAYVSVSEEVQQKGVSRGFESIVIRNPIDLNLFEPRDREKDPVARVLVMCKNPQAIEMVKEAIRGHHSFNIAHRTINPITHIDRHLPEYDAVVSCGRGVYEAMACNVPAYVFDTRAGKNRAEGWVLPENIGFLASRNCSGRYRNRQMTVESLREELREIPEPWGREWVEAHHDVTKAVDQYMEIFDASEKGKREAA